MNDRVEFEDEETVQVVHGAISEIDTAYRAELRQRLGTAPAPRRWRWPFGWRWPALSVAAAAALILALLNPFSPHATTPVSAKTLLERAAQAAAHPSPYVATAVISTEGGNSSALPPGLQRVAADHRMVATYAVRDATHFRMELRTVFPALEAGTMTVVANGHTIVTYSTISRLAWSEPVTAGGAAPIMGIGPGYSMAGTIGALVTELNHPKTGTHARLMGERTVRGRRTYRVRVWPASRETTGSCNTAKACLRASHGYGEDLLWIDKEHLTVLQFEQRGPSTRVQHVLYRVTSITFAGGPSAAQLAYRPPVKVEQPVNGGGFSSSSGSTLGGGQDYWKAPAGFLSAAAPRDAQGHAFLQADEAQDGQPGSIHIAGVAVLFAVRVPGATSGQPKGAVTGPYVYIQERIRHNGLPPFFRTGIPHRAGGCPVWTGSYQNGVRWLGMQKGLVGVMLSSNSFSEGRLVRYARAQFCGFHWQDGHETHRMPTVRLFPVPRQPPDRGIRPGLRHG
jgi:hypothetical protein